MLWGQEHVFIFRDYHNAPLRDSQLVFLEEKHVVRTRIDTNKNIMCLQLFWTCCQLTNVVRKAFPIKSPIISGVFFLCNLRTDPEFRGGERTLLICLKLSWFIGLIITKKFCFSTFGCEMLYIICDWMHFKSQLNLIPSLNFLKKPNNIFLYVSCVLCLRSLVFWWPDERWE